ncbi:BN860_02872g1_1 [Zygosaccharomyces bailii CLIB 213]|uniref:BN860_02872g1_1 n=1 Tax=Zygosaccharomyces bailii (strain CLIB 213 / ATCC 58445 / CBS 680 / BCRC 21525 / NBRC 1098 / NCYC 1416 / NRRL Y-2227) TaxID=1333698 RepID=A0A8J2X4G9_ZYGB2|nr:BN860_02872g1_1 [Zygosaccharomyces bailii CLIB 213]
MLRCCIYRSLGGVRYVGTLIAGDNINNIKLASAYDFVDSLTIRDVCKPHSKRAQELLHLVNSIDDGHEMRRLRNKMKRKFGQQYSLIYPSLKNLSDDPMRLEMIMYRNLGRQQYSAFTRYLQDVVKRTNLDNTNKKQKLYDIIRLQHDLFPTACKRSAINLPREIHEWFWHNIPREESFDHFYFLIKNDVFLSSPPYAWRFAQRMMQGSELELQLSTFQLFLHQEAHQSTFYQKFGKLYSFDSMIYILNRVFKSKDLRFAKLYLSALLHKMEVQGAHEGSLLRFNNTLLYYLSQTDDIESFLRALVVELRLIKMIEGYDELFKMLHRPLVFVLKLLRRQGFHEEFFTIISTVQKLPLSEGHIFKQHIFTELISLLKSFNDPKLTCQYVMSGFNRKATGHLLNELGLWGFVFHGDARVLPGENLQSEINALESLLPKSLSVNRQPSLCAITEIYKTVLSAGSKTMGPGQFRDFIVGLYSKYSSALEHGLFEDPRHDTGVLNVILYHTRFALRDARLAFVLLQDFYSRGLGKEIRITSAKCPFSLVAYQNKEISQADISELLVLMHQNKIPLHFQFCTAMVLRYLELNNVEDAHSWYKRILHAGFKVEHMLLVKAVKDNGWEYPPHFDTKLLEKLENKDTDVADDTFLLEENSEIGDTMGPADMQTQLPSLQHVIDLLKTL